MDNKTHTPNAEMLSKIAERFRALADESRLRIMLRLKQGECNVSTLSSELEIAQPSVSKHLALLRQVGLIQVRHEGPQSLYSIRDASVFDLCEIVCSGVTRYHEQMLEALVPPAPAKKRVRNGL